MHGWNAMPTGEPVKYPDRLFVIRRVSGKVYLPCRPEILIALPEDRQALVSGGHAQQLGVVAIRGKDVVHRDLDVGLVIGIELLGDHGSLLGSAPRWSRRRSSRAELPTADSATIVSMKRLNVTPKRSTGKSSGSPILSQASCRS